MKRAFEEEWPQLAGDLRRSLARKGFSSWLVDDVVQETGLRLFKMWDDVDFLRSPRGLAMTIAGNLLWDDCNRRAGREVLGAIPDRPSDHDVEDAGIARFELGRVKLAMAELSPQHRSILLAEIGHDAGLEGSPASLKMLRMRARRRLSALLEPASASALVPLLGLRARIWRAYGFVRRQVAFAEVPAAAVAALAGAVALMMVPGQATPAPRTERWGGAETRLAAVQASAAIQDDVPLVALAARSGDGARETSATRRGRSKSDDESQSYEVIVGDEDAPIKGGATIVISPDEEPGVPAAPHCSAEPTEDPGVKFRCEAEVPPDKEVTVEGGASLDP